MIKEKKRDGKLVYQGRNGVFPIDCFKKQAVHMKAACMLQFIKEEKKKEMGRIPIHA
ncbi:hypothetical protein SD77_4424 [Bacillus badius]|uniref:Uncharacterized protein n=1 Tax=Bacillus badius TaxID=1455 RepID=A0ABR5AVR4_BACBA|nr:hypothetical protein SD78_0728 [Bacillus badius]KIL78744.1 hypothetical protein SD77_4424 [Bacillus badius]